MSIPLLNMLTLCVISLGLLLTMWLGIDNREKLKLLLAQSKVEHDG